MNKVMLKAVVALVFMGIGAGMSIFGYGLFAEAKASSKWPTVVGTITNSIVDRHSDMTSESRNKFKYSPKVVYAYEVNSVAYESDRLEFVNTTSKNPNDIREIVAKYRIGDAVNVYFDPYEPSSAVLLAGTSWKNYMFLLIGPGLLLGGILVFFIKT